MTITFWAPKAPRRTEAHGAAGYEEYEAEVSVLPEIQLTNSNALTMLEALGVVPCLSGTWSVAQTGEIRRRAMALAAVHEQVGAEVSAGHNASFAPPAPVDGYIRSIALRFVDLLQQARDGGYEVSWG